jgi:hypothetical protein
MVVAVVVALMALMVRMIRGHLFDGGRHLHGYTKTCQPWFIWAAEHASTPSSEHLQYVPIWKGPSEVKCSYLVLVYLILRATLVVGDVECG